MYSEAPSRKKESPLTWRTFGLAFALHVAIGAALWGVAKIIWRQPEVIIPIDMTIVPPWAEVDPDDPEPDPAPPPEPKPDPPPEPKPVPKPDPPKLEKVKQDAVVKEVEKPKKPKFKKAELKKPEKKKPEKEKPRIKAGDFKKKAKLVKNVPRNIPRTGKGTSRDKPLSAADIRKALNAGARYGASNQLAANEEQRCISLISAALKRHWTSEFQWNESLISVHLELHFGAGGRIRNARIVRSSGDAQVDRSVLLAAKNTGAVSGLSQSFLDRYSVLVIEMKPTRR